MSYILQSPAQIFSRRAAKIVALAFDEVMQETTRPLSIKAHEAQPFKDGHNVPKRTMKFSLLEQRQSRFMSRIFGAQKKIGEIKIFAQNLSSHDLSDYAEISIRRMGFFGLIRATPEPISAGCKHRMRPNLGMAPVLAKRLSKVFLKRELDEATQKLYQDFSDRTQLVVEQAFAKVNRATTTRLAFSPIGKAPARGGDEMPFAERVFSISEDRPMSRIERIFGQQKLGEVQVRAYRSKRGLMENFLEVKSFIGSDRTKKGQNAEAAKFDEIGRDAFRPSDTVAVRIATQLSEVYLTPKT